MPTDLLTPRQAAFVREYLVDLNATAAARRAGYSEATANREGARLLSNAVIADAIQAEKAARAERLEITADAVLRQFWTLANADPNELTEYRRTCCRYCHGDGFEYQETEREQEMRRAAALEAFGKRKNGKPTDVFTFDEYGGTGYDGRRDPVEDCPKCVGLGVETVVVADTRKLSPAARRLFAGVRRTKDGVEVKMHDQLAALNAVARHLGMFDEKREAQADPAAMALAIREAIRASDRAEGLAP